MARKFKSFETRDKPKKRPRRHKKNLSKSEKRDHKPYNRQGRKQQIIVRENKSFDPFFHKNLFYEYNLEILEDEIDQVLLLVKNINTPNQKTTYKYLNVLNFPILKKLKKQVINILDNQKLLLTNNWAQLYNTNNNHGVHAHFGSNYSGIIYIKGETPTIFYDREFEKYFHKPKLNTLLLFPSYMPHEVKPLKHDENRLIISFNTNYKL